MSKKTEDQATGQACDCIQCRMLAAIAANRPSTPTDEQRALLMGAMVTALALEVCDHPEFAEVMRELPKVLTTKIAFIKLAGMAEAQH